MARSGSPACFSAFADMNGTGSIAPAPRASLIRSLGAGIALAAALLSGCAWRAASLPLGSTTEAARSRAGGPSERIALPDGGEVWFYATPAGFTTWRLQFDAAGRLTDDRQVLTEASFQNSLSVGHSSTAEVRVALGPPVVISRFPNIEKEVWTYRWMEHTLEMLNDVYFDSVTGRLTGWTVYRDPAFVSVGSY